MRELLEMVAFMVAMAACLFVLIVALFLPIAYWEGTVKAELLEKHAGVSLPWYKAGAVKLFVRIAPDDEDAEVLDLTR